MVPGVGREALVDKLTARAGYHGVALERLVAEAVVEVVLADVLETVAAYNSVVGFIEDAYGVSRVGLSARVLGARIGAALGESSSPAENQEA